MALGMLAGCGDLKNSVKESEDTPQVEEVDRVEEEETVSNQPQEEDPAAALEEVSSSWSQ